ncbi:hypothetical protein [Paenibacillus aestuarii]|uniref:Uncharacterized protein n=1 Tax=Paenibacillus aestuarii TaxID=516965 RepID=A0ABW0K055_9BACL|nr:hypothetical protein [Paenibacillus aestuarii]
MEITFASLNDHECSELMGGIKDLLKESYEISEDEAVLILDKGSESAQKLLDDYCQYMDSIKKISHGLRDTLEKHLKQVDVEDEQASKMVKEAAAWYAFEYIRLYYKNKANIF